MAPNPDPPVPKTREALTQYAKATGAEVPLGIWYEVAMVEFLNHLFACSGTGHQAFLFDWGSPEDRRGASDAQICFPAPDDYCLVVDFTTDARTKGGALVFELNKHWFRGQPPEIEVDGEKLIKGRPVERLIGAAFLSWYKVARLYLPKRPWPKR